MSNYQVLKIIPTPDSAEASSNMLVYKFSTPKNASSIDIDLQTGMYTVGSYSGFIGPGKYDLVKINQFIWP